MTFETTIIGISEGGDKGRSILSLQTVIFKLESSGISKRAGIYNCCQENYPANKKLHPCLLILN
jgi:hypothetical protein